MRTITFVSVTTALLAGCASAPPPPNNYGHPSLNNAQPPIIQAYQVQPAPGYVVVPASQVQGAYVTAPPEPPRNNTGARAVVGAVGGGLIGSQFGRTPNARVAGAATGAALGVMSAQGGPTAESLTGAVIGGVIGSRFGGGSGREAAAAVGAGLGAWLAVPER